ncbi:MAG: chemotaxis protein CheX [Oleiphilaceae bacterium]|nr:chemotaxis protein CheX [Oleiphilaceae bacterium]
MTLKYDIDTFTKHLEQYTCDYLRREIAFENVTSRTQLLEIPELELKPITALISVAGDTNVLVAASFDWPLMRVLTGNFLDTAVAEVEEDDCLDMASEFINIIIGLCTSNLDHHDGHPILFSPPVIIEDAKTIRHHRDSLFFRIDLFTEAGDMNLNCIGPRDIFAH